VRSNRGFTLIEIIVALTIGALVVITAHRIFAAVTDGTKALTHARENLDRTVNARRWLKAAFLSLEPPFEGRIDHASFISWQLAAGGWFEPRSIKVFKQGSQFVAEGTGDPLLLIDGATGVAFDYLLDPGADTKWVREWISPVSAPLAVRLRITGCDKRDAGCVDTLLFLVKERG